MSRWMINCKEHSILASENLDRRLSFWERVSVWIHQMLCPPCQVLQKQLSTIRAACRAARADDSITDPEACRLPNEVSERLKGMIQEIATDKQRR